MYQYQSSVALQTRKVVLSLQNNFFTPLEKIKMDVTEISVLAQHETLSTKLTVVEDFEVTFEKMVSVSADYLYLADTSGKLYALPATPLNKKIAFSLTDPNAARTYVVVSDAANNWFLATSEDWQAYRDSCNQEMFTLENLPELNPGQRFIFDIPTGKDTLSQFTFVPIGNLGDLMFVQLGDDTAAQPKQIVEINSLHGLAYNHGVESEDVRVYLCSGQETNRLPSVEEAFHECFPTVRAFSDHEVDYSDSIPDDTQVEISALVANSSLVQDVEQFFKGGRNPKNESRIVRTIRGKLKHSDIAVKIRLSFTVSVGMLPTITMDISSEALGNQDAQKLYEQVIREYAAQGVGEDIQEAVASNFRIHTNGRQFQQQDLEKTCNLISSSFKFDDKKMNKTSTKLELWECLQGIMKPFTWTSKPFGTYQLCYR